VVHGDDQDSNVLFDEHGAVTAVIDIAGYRTIRRMDDDELEHGAAVYGYERDRSIWLHEELPVHGNERLRVLADDATFVPFADRWAETRSRTTPTARLH
jgi:hypothetical protein